MPPGEVLSEFGAAVGALWPGISHGSYATTAPPIANCPSKASGPQQSVMSRPGIPLVYHSPCSSFLNSLGFSFSRSTVKVSQLKLVLAIRLFLQILSF